MLYNYTVFRIIFLSIIIISSLYGDYINDIRFKAGLSYLFTSSPLTQSALKKAQYISKTTHSYSILTPTLEAKKYGYLSQVCQTISYKENTLKNSINHLMSRATSRFKLLDFSVDQIGYANYKSNYVYNMGNSILDNYCTQNFNINHDQSYYRCGSINQNRVSIKALNSAKQTIAQDQPSYIIWPCNGCKVAPYSQALTTTKQHPQLISGYPITFSINPYKQNIPQYVIIELFDSNNKKIKTKKYNKNYQKNEYAIYPINRLNFNSKYKIKILVKYKNMIKKYISYFKTTGPNMHIYRAGTHIRIKNQNKFALYFPPKKSFNAIDTITYQTNKFVKSTTMQWYDPNTIIVDLKCNDLGEISIQNSYNQEFNLVVKSDKKNPKTDMSLRPKIGEKFKLTKGFYLKQIHNGIVIYTKYKLLFDQDTLSKPYHIKLDFDYPYHLTHTQKYMRNNIDNTSIKTNGDFTRVSIYLLHQKKYTIHKIIEGYEVVFFN